MLLGDTMGCFCHHSPGWLQIDAIPISWFRDDSVWYTGQNRGHEQTLLTRFGGSIGNMKIIVVCSYLSLKLLLILILYFK